MPEKTAPMADRHLLKSIARGDVEALRTLCERHSTSVYALAFGILMHQGEAEEVVAETFSYAWNAAARFAEMANRSVSGWLMEVARGRARGLLLARGWPDRSILAGPAATHAIKEFA
jgi:DNA-directed RNA polymerase specialized sigma24 family protein